jgi:dTDP-4-amino-4,6-dideoxygalactose transaminase
MPASRQTWTRWPGLPGRTGWCWSRTLPRPWARPTRGGWRAAWATWPRSASTTKNIISGEGGALTLTRADLVDRAEIIREKGTNRARFFRGQVDKYTWVDIGSSFLPGELVAAVLYAQLEEAGAILARRLALYDRYREAFAGLAGDGRVTLPHAPNDTTGNGHMFYLLLRDLDDRSAFIAHMRSAGINAPFHYVPLHSAPAGRRFGRAAEPVLAVTDQVSDRLVRLPMFFALEAGIERVIAVATEYFAPGPRR